VRGSIRNAAKRAARPSLAAKPERCAGSVPAQLSSRGRARSHRTAPEPVRPRAALAKPDARAWLSGARAVSARPLASRAATTRSDRSHTAPSRRSRRAQPPHRRRAGEARTRAAARARVAPTKPPRTCTGAWRTRRDRPAARAPGRRAARAGDGEEHEQHRRDPCTCTGVWRTRRGRLGARTAAEIARSRGVDRFATVVRPARGRRGGDAEREEQARRAIRKHEFYTLAVAAGNRTAPPISKGSRRPLTKSGMVCETTQGYALHQWSTGRKSPLLIHPTTNGEDNLHDPQPTPDPRAAVLHRPGCPPRYALDARRCSSAPLVSSAACVTVAPSRGGGEEHEQRRRSPMHVRGSLADAA
jgi:hypothetical protein